MKKTHIGAVVGFTIMAYFAIALYGVLVGQHDHENCIHDDPNPTPTLIDTTDTLQKVQVEVEMIAPKPPMDSLVYAMIQVESRDNDSAYCAVEDAVGCLQIRPIMVEEVNRICKILGIKKAYSLEDRWSRSESVQMLKIFVRFYGLKEFEEIARCWNGGPHGMDYASTEGYWNKVQNELI
jgi:hypothetical protein